MMKGTHFFVLALLTFALSSCFNACKKDLPVYHPDDTTTTGIDTSPDFAVRYSDHTGWTYNQNVYEVNVRQFTPQGTFNAFKTHVPRLSEMGVGILWFMPINPIGVENRKGTLGSYYSVQDYEDVNPEYGTKADFKSLVHTIHQNGMYVIVDWVANHTSWDNVLTYKHPEYYLRTSTGDFQSPPGQDWTDVIQLDYSNPDLQDYMITTLKNWVIEYGIDGFRFDYVSGIPDAFWQKATRELKNLKADIFLMAEGEGVKYHTMGFDMDYCWALQGWDVGLMRQIYEGSKKVYNLNSFLDQEKTNYMPDKYHMYFTSNHDENSWHGTEFEQLGVSHQAFAVLTETLWGMPLIYNGQESAMNKRLNFFEKDNIPWGTYIYADFYSKLNHLRDTCQALWNGNKGPEPIRVNTTLDEKIFAYSRTQGNSKVIVILNLTGTQNAFNLTDDTHAGVYTNLFDGGKTTLSKANALTLKAWGYLVLVK